MRKMMRARTCRCAVNFSIKHISDIWSKLTFGHFGLSSLSLFLIAKKVKITVVMTSTRKSNAYEPVIRFIIFVVSYFLCQSSQLLQTISFHQLKSKNSLYRESKNVIQNVNFARGVKTILCAYDEACADRETFFKMKFGSQRSEQTVPNFSLSKVQFPYLISTLT